MVCAPSRAAFLTGKYTIHSGVCRNDEDLPADRGDDRRSAQAAWDTGLRFSANGTAASPGPARRIYVHPMDQGFDAFFGYADANQAWEKFPAYLGSGRERIAVSGYFDDLITDRAVDFVEKNSRQPFLPLHGLCRHPFCDCRAGR